VKFGSRPHAGQIFGFFGGEMKNGYDYIVVGGGPQDAFWRQG
jgi:hypothetical protein